MAECTKERRGIRTTRRQDGRANGGLDEQTQGQKKSNESEHKKVIVYCERVENLKKIPLYDNLQKKKFWENLVLWYDFLQKCEMVQ